MTKPIDAERMRHLFRYEDGQLICRVSRKGGTRVGDVAGSLHKPTGYLRVRVDGQEYKVSRIIYAMHYGDPGSLLIDHIDQDKTNNRIENMRVVTNKENRRNLTKNTGNTSGYTGVVWHKSSQKWNAQIRVNGKHIHLGTFSKIEDAATVRKSAEQRYRFHENHGKNKQVAK